MKKENTHILQLTNLSIGYHQPLISHIQAEINKGEMVLLAGKNGCGKTTLLKTIYKELLAISGNIKIMEQDISKIPVSEIGKLVSVVLSHSELSPSLKVYDLIALGRYPYKKWYERLTEKEVKEIGDILNLLDLEKYKNYYVSELSDGNLQKALIARALIQDCPLLILDEPTSHLDISNKLEIMKLLSHLAKEKGKTILFTSHDLNLGLSVADKLWLIKENQLFTGFTEDLANRENILEYFAGNSVEFDYNSREFGFINSEKKKEVQISECTQSLYWLQKALIRNRFSVKREAEIQISEKEGNFIVHQQEKEFSFSTIQEVIDFLESKEF